MLFISLLHPFPRSGIREGLLFKSVNSLYYSVKSPVPVKEELLFKSGIKVAAPPPPPIININNSHLSTPTSYTAIYCGVVILKCTARFQVLEVLVLNLKMLPQNHIFMILQQHFLSYTFTTTLLLCLLLPTHLHSLLRMYL